ncbi:MAG: indole-3-glycerol phosphate synthase TrpC [Nitrospiria bacterium]
MFLDEIVGRKKEEVRRKKNIKYLTEMKAKISQWDENNALGKHLLSFEEVLSGNARLPTEINIHLIAEIKKASPSKGILRENFSPVEIAGIYESSGATAISILTEENYFMGSLSHLEEVRNKVKLPLLRKDFLIDEIEIIEAKAYGASAILLIAAILEPNQMHEYFLQAKDIGLDVLTEVHSEKELEKVVEWAPVIGINNRDLTTFEVDLRTTVRMLKYIPKGRIVVSESGISKKEELFELIAHGVNAVLIGEVFMRQKDVKFAVERLFSKNRDEEK